jgi:hypothetical protein
LKRLLAAVAILPIACTKPSETATVADASISHDPVIASSSAPGISEPPLAAIVSASASAWTTTSAPSKRQTCEALQSKVGALIAGGRACTSTADCAIVQTGCGLDGQCGTPIAKTRKPDVEKTSALFFGKNCLDVLPPQACATCPMPPVPKCVNGQCN